MMHIVSKVTAFRCNDGTEGNGKASQDGRGAAGQSHRQEEAVVAISKALRRSRADLKDPRGRSAHLFFSDRPASVRFSRANPAEFMFGTVTRSFRSTCPEYRRSSRFAVDRSPPGYVGYERGRASFRKRSGGARIRGPVR